MKTLNIGLIGFGTIGAGVVESIQKNVKLIEARTGITPVITKIADLDIITDRGVKVPDGVLMTDAMALIESPDVEVVIELVGGTTIAKKFVVAALTHGKSVVTANKALLAKYGKELFELADHYHCEIYFEASVGGGIPCIKALREGLVANHIEKVYGILNGTCNYILTKMECEKADFTKTLLDAQEAGYAEANPSADIDGYDTANKAAIIASLAFGKWFSVEDVDVQGIRDVTVQDIEFAASLGYRIKLLAVIKNVHQKIQLSVHPSLVPFNSLISHVNDVFNALLIQGDIVGSTMYYGRGAGRAATSSAVIADLIDLGLNKACNSARRLPAFPQFNEYKGLLPSTEVRSRFYVRLQVEDSSGVLSKISGILGNHHISIASVSQNESRGNSVPMIMLTHIACQDEMKKALIEIEKESQVLEKPVIFRIEDLER
ncbi:MAG: homoserine dehydrogenase [Lentisphaeria bacterium]